MKEKVNLSEIEERPHHSPKGNFQVSRKDVSGSLETGNRPFEIDWVRLQPGMTNFPYHAHQIQWEFYIVVSGRGTVRRNDRTFEVETGDVFVQPPGTAHHIRNPSEDDDLVYYVIADNPVCDPCYYPDSDKWAIRPPGKLGRITDADYYDGEE